MSVLPTDPRPRYAVYYAPDETSALWRFGTMWLGRDAITGETPPRSAVDGLDPQRLAEITAEASHYGFHATLKPPFVLQPDENQTSLERTLTAFVASRRPFRAPRLEVSEVAGFLAVTCSSPCDELHYLADDCVRALEPYRAPLTTGEVARRRQTGLTSRQHLLLDRWGYPYVMDEWRFHMTLTARLEDHAERKKIAAALSALGAEALAQPLTISSICLFRQESRAHPFYMIARFPFGG